MRKPRLALPLALLCFNQLAHAAGPLPEDVAKFIERRDLCDHFRGEEPYDQERKAFLDKSINASCPGTDQELAGLRAKYKHDAAILEHLAPYASAIEH